MSEFVYHDAIISDKGNVITISDFKDKEAAVIALKKLDDAGCTDCVDCVDCSECDQCIRCVNCSECSDCVDCTGCENCDSCIECVHCKNCVSCCICTSIANEKLSFEILQHS